jgi:hypothetical protein
MHRNPAGRPIPRRFAGPGIVATIVITVAVAACSGGSATTSTAPVALRLQVALTPEESATFRPAIARLDADHPEWTIALEEVP